MITAATVQDIHGLVEMHLEFEAQEHALANAMFAAQGLPPLPLQVDEQDITETFMTHIADQSITLLVAREGQTLLGYVCGWSTGKEVYDSSQDRAVLDTVVVRKCAQGAGIGTQLCEALETWFRQHGYGSIDLQCFYQNEGARRLYERRGYVPTVVRMTKILRPV